MAPRAAPAGQQQPGKTSSHPDSSHVDQDDDDDDDDYEPKTQPITLLSSSTAARSLVHAQPVILLAALYARFSALVADPVSTMLSALPALTVLQAVFAIVCLPPTASTVPPRAAQQKTSGKGAGARPAAAAAAAAGAMAAKRKIQADGSRMGSKVMTAVLAVVLTFALSAPSVTVLMVLFGAPATTHHAHTFLCALHLALLAVFPLIYVHGLNPRSWWEIAGAMLPFDSVWGATIGAFVGGWLGAIPIPLDWDREWQKWPITILVGIYIGSVAGKYLGEFVFRGKRISFD